LNIGVPNDGYKRGVCALYAWLTGNDNVATQHVKVAQRICPNEFEILLFRQVEGITAVAARNDRDNVDAFGVNVREDILKNDVRTRAWWVSVPDCVDRVAVLVGHPNFTAVGPKAYRHYRWSFNFFAKRPSNLRLSTITMNPKDVALLAR
jgi:hypothetical protein